MSPTPPIRGGFFVLCGWQIRAARVMARLTVDEVAKETGLSSKTIKRIEAQDGFPNSKTETLLTLQAYFMNRGITFIPEDGSPEGPGVRWGTYPGRSIGH